MPVKLLELKGGLRHLIEKLGVETPEASRTEGQKLLRQIAVVQNFCRVNPEMPTWAKGAFVYVRVGDAAYLQQAVEESGFELKPRHILVSDEYTELLKMVIGAPAAGTGRDAYQRGRAGAVAREVAVPTATFAAEQRRSESFLGAVDVVVGDMHLTCKHTFLEFSEAQSINSRLTRSTGDRPIGGIPPVEIPGAERLPPVDADYGPHRKNFLLQSLTVPAEVQKEVELGSDTDDKASSSSLPLSSEGLEDNYANISQYLPELNERLKQLNLTDPAPRLVSQCLHPGMKLPPDAAIFVKRRADLFLEILQKFLGSALDPKDVAALSAFEDHEEQLRASSSVFDVLEQRSRLAIRICRRCLQLNKIFGRFGIEPDAFDGSLYTAVNQRLEHFRRSVRKVLLSPKVSPLDVLRTGVWKAVRDVIHDECLGGRLPQCQDEGHFLGTIMVCKDTYGFLDSDMGPRNVFYHMSALAKDSHIRREGQRVTFTLGRSNKDGRLQAENVRLLRLPPHVLNGAKPLYKDTTSLYLDSTLLPPDEEEEDDGEDVSGAGGSHEGERDESDSGQTWAEDHGKGEKANDEDEVQEDEEAMSDTPAAVCRGGGPSRARGRGRGGVPRNLRKRREFKR